ncbi:MAG: hypothetical protein A2622_04235 [Bdellovibrionales bacterium RIFCSPHIGHO2_01_FULL_40_29]|nr:MAG: hypothetical protein A2622_04235 [Bdellovibrionales bacterium RIFCSPHIGHO2_01_FULL_40_29]OFZ34853.1 MAG: hypothetical protein A3D17_11140 [Bdellovibrionales bacterium RIFCSPHIGHO2_02_FULL_40_15]
MKKNFSLTSPTHKPDRQVELVKQEINKYIARERRKAFPAGVDFWDFDCKCGPDADSAVVTHVSEIGKQVDKIAATNVNSVYIEILAKPGIRNKKS